jgi:phosphoribosylformylglycinamidine synthase subunit PurSL
MAAAPGGAGSPRPRAAEIRRPRAVGNFLSEAQERMTLAVRRRSSTRFLALARAARSRRPTSANSPTRAGSNVTTRQAHRRARHGIPARRRADDDAGRGWNAAARHRRSHRRSTRPDATSNACSVRLNVCSKEASCACTTTKCRAQSVLKQFQGVEERRSRRRGGHSARARFEPRHRGRLRHRPKYSDLDTYAHDGLRRRRSGAQPHLPSARKAWVRLPASTTSAGPTRCRARKRPTAHKLAQLVRCCEALYETCVAYDIPLISGKDSMKNDYKIGDTKISIPPTVLFTAAPFSTTPPKVVSMDVKRPGDAVLRAGRDARRMGGSEYLALRADSWCPSHRNTPTRSSR